MSFDFSETDDYAEIVDEEDTYTMPSSKSLDFLFFDAEDHFCHAGELCKHKENICQSRAFVCARPSNKVNGDGMGRGGGADLLPRTSFARRATETEPC